MNTAANAAGSVVITGPTGGLGRYAVLAMAQRPAADRPDLVLLGRPGPRLDAITTEVRALGATAHPVGVDLSNLGDVQNAAGQVRDLVDAGTIAPLRAIVANAGLTATDTRRATADGYEVTFAVNYLAHAALIGDLLDHLAKPSRVVLLGSNTYHENFFRRLLHVPPAEWEDPLRLAQPAPADSDPSLRAAGVAYSNSKLALMYFAHELQRQAPGRVSVIVFEPGFMPGSGLSREHGAQAQRIGQLIERIPRVSSPSGSGPLLASVALDARWAGLRDGAFVVKTDVRPVQPFAVDADREAELWRATVQLLDNAPTAPRPPGRRTVDPRLAPSGTGR